MELSGWVFVALAVTVLGYLVPHLVRRREVMVESRVNDRFSEQMRLVTPQAPSSPQPYRPDARPLVHNPEVSRRRTEALAMIRPTTPVAHRVNARELATARAARAAEISRRGAAARRRLTLAVALGLLTAVLVAFAVTGSLHWLAAVPSGLLFGGVVWTGRKAGAIAAQQDARARAEMARLDQRLRLFRTEEAASRDAAPPSISPTVAEEAEPGPVAVAATTHARPAEASGDGDGRPGFEEIVAGYQGKHVATRVIEDEPPRHARTGNLTAAAGSWTPVPVPVPTYTLKQEAPRRDVEPYAAEVPDAAGRVPLRPTAAAPGTPGGEEPVAQAFDLESVLARRRAAGA